MLIRKSETPGPAMRWYKHKHKSEHNNKRPVQRKAGLTCPANEFLNRMCWDFAPLHVSFNIIIEAWTATNSPFISMYPGRPPQWTLSVPTLIFFLFTVGRSGKINVCFRRWKRKQRSNSVWQISPNCVRVIHTLTTTRAKKLESNLKVLLALPQVFTEKNWTSVLNKEPEHSFVHANFKKTY